jgi:hypothetical protein
LNVTTVFLAAFVPLRLKTGVPPVGSAVTAHVYVRVDSPAVSPPRTVSWVLVPVTGLALELAGATTVGGVVVEPEP